MKLVKTSFFLTALLLLSGCLPEFKNSLTKLGKQDLDVGLIGKWAIEKTKKNGKKKYTYYTFSTVGSMPYYVLKSWQIRNGTRTDNKGVFHVHTSSINGHSYMNLKPIGIKDTKNYLILKYKFIDNKLAFNITNPITIRKAIKNGELRGHIPQYKRADGTMADSIFRSPTVTSSRRKLRKFFIKNDKKLFNKKYQILNRVTNKES